MKYFSAAKYIFVSMVFLVPLPLEAELWTVVLTKKQEVALSELAEKPSNTAFAISPDGAWGRAWGTQDEAKSAARALSYCREYVKKGKRDCVLYMVNGRRSLPEIIDIKRIRNRYKAIHGQKAASFFGLASIEFTGDRAAALEEFEFTKNDGQAWRTIPKSRALKHQLTDRGLVSVGKNGWAVFLGKDHASQVSGSQSGLLRSKFEQWAISENGLLCMFFGKTSKGKPRSTTCMLINKISRGEMQYNWAINANNRTRRGFIVAGDAGRNTVK